MQTTIDLLFAMTVLLAILCGCSKTDDRSNEATVLNQIDFTSFEQSITHLIEKKMYRDAILFIRTLDIKHIAVLESQNDNMVYRYWCVIEDGRALPGLNAKAFEIDDYIAIKDTAWCFPGTSDAQNAGEEAAWQGAAYAAALEYNEHLYELLQHHSQQ
ncbi:MAG: hypothetical protein AAGI37_11940 [Planctomycetota bacterium]